VLKWVVDRVKGRVDADRTPIGLVPRKEDINLAGLEIAPDQLRQATAIDAGEWLAELNQIEEYFKQLGADAITGFADRIRSARAELQKQR